MDEAAFNGGNLALRMVLLINGGAAVALLSFMGGLPKDQRQAITGALVWLAWGVVCRSIRPWPGVHHELLRGWWLPLDGVLVGLSVRQERAADCTQEKVEACVPHRGNVIGALVFFVVGMLRVKSAFINL